MARVPRRGSSQSRTEKQDELDETRTRQLLSVVDALYEEMDKLNRKGPAMSISELTLERVNRAIRAAKDLLKNQKDEFVDELTEFVPAGDMPQYRDVVLVVSQVRAGLRRFKSDHPTWRWMQ